MYDKELLLETLRQVHKLTKTIIYRFEPVKNVTDFTGSPAGMEKLDSICMPLIAIGMRNIISHQYFDIDAEAVFQACDIEIPRLANTIKKMIKDIKKNK